MKKFLLIFVLLLCGAGEVAGQQATAVPDAPGTEVPLQWMANASYVRDVVSNGRADWEHVQISAGRRFSRGALLLEAGRISRFGLTETTMGLDAYAELWRSSHANVRYSRAADGVILPANDIYFQIYQAIGHGAEVSAIYQHRSYAEQAVNLAGAELGLYRGNWYLSTRTSVLPHGGTVGVVQSASARLFWATRHDFLVLSAAGGRGLEMIDSGPLLVLTRTYAVSARVQRLIMANLAVSALAAFSNDDFYRRTTFGAGLTAVW